MLRSHLSPVDWCTGQGVRGRRLLLLNRTPDQVCMAQGSVAKGLGLSLSKLTLKALSISHQLLGHQRPHGRLVG